MSKPFIPRDKPKSWVVAMLAGICNMLFSGPMMLLGAIFKIQIIKSIGITLFLAGCITFVVMLLIFQVNNLNGVYKNLKEDDWSNQLW
jgi:hypothetical protein